MSHPIPNQTPPFDPLTHSVPESNTHTHTQTSMTRQGKERMIFNRHEERQCERRLSRGQLRGGLVEENAQADGGTTLVQQGSAAMTDKPMLQQPLDNHAYRKQGDMFVPDDTSALSVHKANASSACEEKEQTKVSIQRRSRRKSSARSSESKVSTASIEGEDTLQTVESDIPNSSDDTSQSTFEQSPHAQREKERKKKRRARAQHDKVQLTSCDSDNEEEHHLSSSKALPTKKHRSIATLGKQNETNTTRIEGPDQDTPMQRSSLSLPTSFIKATTPTHAFDKKISSSGEAASVELGKVNGDSAASTIPSRQSSATTPTHRARHIPARRSSTSDWYDDEANVTAMVDFISGQLETNDPPQSPRRGSKHNAVNAGSFSDGDYDSQDSEDSTESSMHSSSEATEASGTSEEDTINDPIIPLPPSPTASDNTDTFLTSVNLNTDFWDDLDDLQPPVAPDLPPWDHACAAQVGPVKASETLSTAKSVPSSANHDTTESAVCLFQGSLSVKQSRLQLRGGVQQPMLHV